MIPSPYLGCRTRTPLFKPVFPVGSATSSFGRPNLLPAFAPAPEPTLTPRPPKKFAMLSSDCPDRPDRARAARRSSAAKPASPCRRSDPHPHSYSGARRPRSYRARRRSGPHAARRRHSSTPGCPGPPSASPAPLRETAIITPDFQLSQGYGFIHLFNESWRQTKTDKNSEFPRGSFMDLISRPIEIDFTRYGGGAPCQLAHRLAQARIHPIDKPASQQ